MINHKNLYKGMFWLLAAFVLTFIFFQYLYQYDNKYTRPAPYGIDGVITITDSDLKQQHLIQLIDGWEFYPDVSLEPQDFKQPIQAREYIFIGKYPNYSFIEENHSPFGSATYRYTIHYDGDEEILALAIPEIFTQAKLWINQQPIELASTVYFPAKSDNEIIISAENHSHYYSGLTYPIILGTPSDVDHRQFIQCLCYSSLCLIPLTLALYAAASWKSRNNDPRFLHFGLLCLFFAIHSAYPFIAYFKLNTALWYAIEDSTWLAVLYEMIALVTLEAGLENSKWYQKGVRPLIISLCILCALSVLFILPNLPYFIKYYGTLLDLYKCLCWLYLVICAVAGTLKQPQNEPLILIGGGILGASLAVNLFDNNQFEPIYTLWQNEYAAFFLILIFWYLTLQYTKQLIQQNERLTRHLEETVNQRTAELYGVLDERKAFFSDLAHNLKAPMASINGFTQLIQRGNLYLDDELKSYIERIQYANNELCSRMQALSDLNAYDKIIEPYENVSIHDLFKQIYTDNEPEASISGINFQVIEPADDVYIYAQRKKLLILFENLIYNALAFTDEDGTISITAQIMEQQIKIDVADTGSGIAPDKLPHIFERFYVGRDNKEEGSGLGLYIVHLIIEELGGTIQADSELNIGTTFTIRLPIMSSDS